MNIKTRKLQIGEKTWQGLEITARRFGMTPHTFSVLVLEHEYESLSARLLEALENKARGGWCDE